MKVRNIAKAATFKSFLHLSYKNTKLLFLWTVLFNTFMRQTLNDDFGGLHEDMNCNSFNVFCHFDSTQVIFQSLSVDLLQPVVKNSHELDDVMECVTHSEL